MKDLNGVGMKGQSHEMTKCPKVKESHCPLRFLLDGKSNVDVLHKKASNKGTKCTGNACKSSLMSGLNLIDKKTDEEIYDEATDFINQYYASLKQDNTNAHLTRLDEVQSLLKQTGTYELTEAELEFGARTAWRNASRCINRIYWSKLKLFDARKVTTAKEMYEAIIHYITYSSNGGNIRPTITVFRQRTHPDADFRIWNKLLFSYAGYKKDDGTIIGDPAYVDFTLVCQKLGWVGEGTDYDLLPLVLQANGGPPEWFELPKELPMEVSFSHPQYDWFADLNLKWPGIPSVTDMMLDVGGIQFNCAPFNGWFLGTEIGRDFAEVNRYNKLPLIAEKMGLDTKASISLWRDKALVELNLAILHSFQKAKVTLVDHHTATESFVKHYENEMQTRGGCPGDWVWLVPPMSGHLTQVFHLEMLNYMLKPSFGNQDYAWKTNDFLKRHRHAKARLRSTIIAVRFAAISIAKIHRNRVNCTILYATETGRSEKFAKVLCEIFKHAFNVKLSCIADFDLTKLTLETLVLTVTSTYGNGDAPENGESLRKYLTELKDSLKTQTNLQNLSYSVFGLGNSSYPNFCAFGKLIDGLLEDVGAKRIHALGLGDHLSGQEDVFNEWAHSVFKTASNVFSLQTDVKFLDSLSSATNGLWSEDSVRLVLVNESKLSIHESLSKFHKKDFLKLRLAGRKNLQHEHSGRRTNSVTFEPYDATQRLFYQPGDHVGLCPANRKELVNGIVERVVDAPPDSQVLRIERADTNDGITQDANGFHENWTPDDTIPNCTLREALTYFCDITTPPTQKFISNLILLATSPADIAKLRTLINDAKFYENWKNDCYPNTLEVLNDFPSVKMTTKFLLTQLPCLKYRPYSISSSPNTANNQIQITSVVVEYTPIGVTTTNTNVHYGVCSKWLEDLSEDDQISAFIREAPGFRLPDSCILPIIMVAAGTGIAPFRSMWQERRYRKQQQTNTEFGDMALYFGCRSTQDQLYKNEIESMIDNETIKSYHVAHSRANEAKKVYVQDLMLKHSTHIYNQIYHQNAHLYVCGDVRMASDVTHVIETIISNEGSVGLSEAKEYVKQLKRNKRFHEDIFGVTHRST